MGNLESSNSFRILLSQMSDGAVDGQISIIVHLSSMSVVIIEAGPLGTYQRSSYNSKIAPTHPYSIKSA
jgi:hypothetical protein